MYMTGHYVASAVPVGGSDPYEEAFAARAEAVFALSDRYALPKEVAHRVARDGFADTDIGTLDLAEVFACDCDRPETHRPASPDSVAADRELVAVG